MHPAPHRFQRVQRVEGLVRFGPRCDAEARSDQRVLGLEAADQAQAHLVDPATPFETQFLPRGIETLTQNAQRRHLVTPDGQKVLPPVLDDLGHAWPPGIVDVDDGGAVVGQHAVEKTGLGCEIVFEISVVIQMILAEVGKGCRRQADAVKPPLGQAVT